MRSAFAFVACLVFLPATAHAADKVDYLRDVKPLLKERCYACHGALQQKAKLRLDTAALMRKGGRHGNVLAAGDSGTVLIVQRITDADESQRMPPAGQGKALSAQQIELLKTWINQGAIGPDNEKPEADPLSHWAFQRPVRAAVPALRTSHQPNSPIDAFLGSARERRGIVPVPPAERATLLRRVYLDLVGLPPSPAELHAFLTDVSADAYEKVVDRLLNDPRHGERWARHWMDVWRYSDWYGRRSVPDVMNSYAQIWRWRDWIVRSLNEDKGYDRMVAEMLAADEIAPGDNANVVATGFLVRNWFKWNYNQWMRDDVEHTAKAFLGLTLNCCHCHDHKYDPITQKEYFQFRAFFEPLELRHDRCPGEADPGPFVKYVYGASYGPMKSGLIRVFDEKLGAQTFMYSGGDERQRMPGKGPVDAKPPAFLNLPFAVKPVTLPESVSYPGLQDFVRNEEQDKCKAAIVSAEAELSAARASFEKALPALNAAIVRRSQERDKARQAARASGSKALAGVQSLFLNAVEGRRILANNFPGLQKLPEGSALTFQLRILSDDHFNFQFAEDIGQGLTSGYVGFVKGKILSYQPGTSTEFEVGSYDCAKGQNQFEIGLKIELAKQRALLTITNAKDRLALVKQVPVAVNRWNPTGQPRQGIFCDCRSGTSVEIDDLILAGPDKAVLFRCDFEEPAYHDGDDVLGRAGWSLSSLSVAPASSIVSTTAVTPLVERADQHFHIALRARDAKQFAVLSADAKLAAAHASRLSLDARIAADRIKFGNAPRGHDAASRIASRAERQAKFLAASAALTAAEHALAVAESQSLTSKGRAAAIQKAVAQRKSAQGAANQAATALQGDSTAYTPLGPVYPKESTGRRKALAEWITNQENPLTARVAANYIWAWHFGRPLVASTANFGRSGKTPSHPQLLDWLAVELMENGWQMKRLHRLIVTSNAYRMRSQPESSSHPNQDRDPDNILLWRFPTLRMDAEVVRDSLLHVTGELDAKIGGPELPHEQGMTVLRRSLYFAHHGESKMEFLELFDGASASECYQRSVSVLPQQALALSNSDLTLRQGRRLARKLWGQITALPNANEAFTTVAFERVLGRRPSAAEQETVNDFFAQQESLFRGMRLAPSSADGPSDQPAMRARENLVIALFNHSDFVTIR